MINLRYYLPFLLVLIILFPSQSKAIECPELKSGDLFKVPNNNAVYLLNNKLERMYFPSSDIYHTWYEDFSGIREISGACVDNYPAPVSPPYGVNYRPGSRLVKTKLSPSVFAVLPNNTRAKIGSESVARDLYGFDWADRVRDVPETYWPNYVAEVEPIETNVPHSGMQVHREGSSLIYQVVDGELRIVTGEIKKNVLKDVRSVPFKIFSSLPVSLEIVYGADITGFPAQEIPAQEEVYVGSDCISNIEPVFTSNITDLNLIRAISAPGGVTPSGDWKGHSFVWIKDKGSRVPIYAPVDMVLNNGAYYSEFGENNYTLRFDVSCEIIVKFDHIKEPIEEIVNNFSLEPKPDNSQDQGVVKPISFKAGDLIGYTVGTNGASNWDFGVYDNTVGAKEDAVCGFDYFIQDKKSIYYSMFVGTSGSGSPVTTICK
jgi:hypothetical protein